MQTRPHIVLIHGAWQGSWAFDIWRPFLEDAGWQVHAIDLPGNGHNGALLESRNSTNLDGYTAHVVRILETLDSPAVVVGHSGGGITASQVAEAAPERVRTLVYLAGMMLPSGESLEDIINGCFAQDPAFTYTGVLPSLKWSEDGESSEVPLETALDLFLHDCPPDIAAVAAHKLTPQLNSGRDMVNSLTAHRFGNIPRIYVECTADRSITLPLQRLMQLRTPGAYRISLDCGHVPQVACPEKLTEALMSMLENIFANSSDVTPH